VSKNIFQFLIHRELGRSPHRLMLSVYQKTPPSRIDPRPQQSIARIIRHRSLLERIALQLASARIRF
jgi:hypothetical protein